MANPQRKNFEQLANAVRYYRWFADTVRPWVGSAILDVGCGHGNVIWNFLGAERVVGIDIESEYVAHVARRFAGFPNFHAEVRDITEDTAVEALRLQHFDTAIAFNVVEHIADDVAAVRHMHEILAPGGHCIILAPAFDALMSPYDAAVGHYRRYTRRTAETLAARAGFRIVHSRYFNMLGALAWLWTYKWRRRDEPGSGSIRALEFLVPALRALEHVVQAPFGMSVIVVGGKDDAGGVPTKG